MNCILQMMIDRLTNILHHEIDKKRHNSYCAIYCRQKIGYLRAIARLIK